MTAPGLAGLSAAGIAALVASGKVSAVEVTEAFIARTRDLEPELRTYVTFDPEGALDQARAIDRARAEGHLPGPMAGVPLSVKDQYRTRGLRSTGGSQIHADHVPAEDAAFVARLRAAGAVILGKTTTPEFGMFWRPAGFVAPESRNPYDRGRTTGGSSGGAAGGVAARLVPAAIGSDGGGSIRLPAAFCGVMGLHPTLGRVPRHGGFGGALHFTQVGPIARDPRDLALVLSVISGPDDRDPLTRFAPPLDLSLDPPAPEDLCLAWWEVEDADHDPRVIAAARHAASRLASALHYDLSPLAPDAIDVRAALTQFQAISRADRFKLHGRPLYEEPASRARLTPYVREAYAIAATVTGADYARALEHRLQTQARLANLFRHHDLILSPTAGTTALPIPDDLLWRPAGYITYTFIANYTGIPALTLPCGIVDRLPVGLQIMGPGGSEPLLLAAAGVARQVLGDISPPN